MAGGGLQPGCAIGGCAGISMVVMFVLLLSFAFLGGPGVDTASADENDSSGQVTATCGETIDTLISGVRMLPGDSDYKPISSGKLGHEEHLDNTEPSHYCGTDSGNCDALVHTGFVNPHTTDQEHWYFNARWFGWTNNGMSFSTEKGAAQARKKIKHAKVVITLNEPGKESKSLVVSVEEYGPGTRLHTRDGIDFGAPPEVYKYFGGSSPYTKNPGDKKSLISIAFAKDQENTKLGPCK